MDSTMAAAEPINTKNTPREYDILNATIAVKYNSTDNINRVTDAVLYQKSNIVRMHKINTFHPILLRRVSIHGYILYL